MNTDTDTTADVVAGVFIELKALPDPLYVRHGLPAREPIYRLKLALKRLLREYGLRCDGITNKIPAPSATPVPRTPRSTRKRTRKADRPAEAMPGATELKASDS